MFSTDGMKIAENLNNFLRNPQKIISPEQGKALEYLNSVMNSGLEKLPTAGGHFFARADGYDGWKDGLQELKGFTYATTDRTRTFI